MKVPSPGESITEVEIATWLVKDGDYVKAGMPLSNGAITPSDILAIQGPTAVQEYIVNEVQKVYLTQGVVINNKHFEVIV